jgi:hypothetical protein
LHLLLGLEPLDVLVFQEVDVKEHAKGERENRNKDCYDAD